MSRLFTPISLVAAVVVIVGMFLGARTVAASVAIVAHLASLAVLTYVEHRVGDRRPIAGLAERNARRVTPLAICGGLAMLAAALFPASSSAIASLVISSAATSFNVGTFAVEAVSLSAQWRLLNELSPESSC